MLRQHGHNWKNLGVNFSKHVADPAVAGGYVTHNPLSPVIRKTSDRGAELVPSGWDSRSTSLFLFGSLRKIRDETPGTAAALESYSE